MVNTTENHRISVGERKIGRPGGAERRRADRSRGAAAGASKNAAARGPAPVPLPLLFPTLSFCVPIEYVRFCVDYVNTAVSRCFADFFLPLPLLLNVTVDGDFFKSHPLKVYLNRPTCLRDLSI